MPKTERMLVLPRRDFLGPHGRGRGPGQNGCRCFGMGYGPRGFWDNEERDQGSMLKQKAEFLETRLQALLT